MALNSIEEIIEDIRAGKMVILMDDEDRENEGDLIVAAEKVTPEIITFMATQARGLICLTLTGDRCDQLNLPSMVQSNGMSFGTHFTVSIEAAEGVTTGISAADRAQTILAAVALDAKPDDIVQPGHVFPLRAHPGGVLSRAGHTEAGCDLARMAGLIPATAIVEVMNDDGTMARRPDLEKFAEQHGLKIGTIADLIQYRIMHERSIEIIDERKVETLWGEFDMRVYRDNIGGGEHAALFMGEFTPEQPALVRVHVAQAMRDLLGIEAGERHQWSVQRSLQRVAEEGHGVVALVDIDHGLSVLDDLERYHSGHKGRRDPNTDKSGAYTTIGIGSQILKDLNIGKMKLLSAPMKFGGISGFGLEVVEYINFEQTDSE